MGSSPAAGAMAMDAAETTKTRARNDTTRHDATRGGRGDNKGQERSMDDAVRESGE
jgi:hypothetical protein